MGTDNQNTENFMAHYHQRRKDEATAVLLEHREGIEAFLALTSRKGIVLNVADVSYVEKIGIVASAPKLLERLAGRFERERDGLVPFSTFPLKFNFERAYAGYFNAEYFVPMAHPHFRRGLQDECHFAPCFIELFWNLSNGGLNKYIALDENRVMLDIFLGEIMEKSTWFGAPFNQDVSQVPNGISKLKPPPHLSAHHTSWLFADAHCLDIKWSQESGIKTFQALEIKSESTRLNVDGEAYYPARYLHAEFDTATNEFRHFDGAMQYLTEPEYQQRRNSDFNYNAKNRHQIKSRSKKLFKVNGPLSTERWSDLCCHFFADNPLMFEYFMGGYPDHVNDVLARIEMTRGP